MTSQEYDNYISSAEWAEKRKQRMKIDHYRCCMCGKSGKLQVHHVSYDRLGHEDVFHDLCTLCPECHKLIHNYYNRKRNRPLEYKKHGKEKNKI